MRKNSHLGLSLALMAALWIGACSKSNNDSSTGNNSDKGSGASSMGGGTVDGGGTGGSEMAAKFKVESQSPAPNDDNANALLPITITFTDVLDASTVKEGLTVQSGGNNLLFEVEVSGRNATITLAEPLGLPAKVSLAASSSILSASGTSLVGEAWNFEYPLWQSPVGDAGTSSGNIAYATVNEASPFLVTVTDEGLAARIHQEGKWSDVEAPPTTSGSTIRLLGMSSLEGGAVACWVETIQGVDTVVAAKFKNDAWTRMDGGAKSGTDLVAAFSVEDKRILIVTASDSAFDVHEYAGATWTQVGVSGAAKSTISELALTLATGGISVALVNGASDIEILQWTSSWNALGENIARYRTTDPANVQLKASGAELYVAYLDGDDETINLQVATFTTAWEPVGSALDLLLDAEVRLPTLAIDPQGIPVVAWIEKDAGPEKLLVARAEEKDWRILGEVVDADVHAKTDTLALAFDQKGNASVAANAPEGVRIKRFNNSPTLPAGLTARGDWGDCNIPEDMDNFPGKLSDTGCYEDLPTNQLVSAAIPFNINSILWSDGAYKQRYLLLPEDATIGFKETGALEMPLGTLIIKEFYLEKTKADPDTRFVVETRFLIKRCEEEDTTCISKWQGYSYRWLPNGSDGVLLDGAAGETLPAWEITDGANTIQHEHSYPSRAECVNCHNKAAGRVLGVQAPQLNRPQSYGGTIDNQLRAWTNLGLFGVTAPANPPESMEKIPSPPDVGRTLEERARGYFHANCAHCHRPGGQKLSPDFRYFGPGLKSVECVEGALKTGPIITPGDHLLSELYTRDEDRGSNIQMPKLATIISDDRQLKVTAAWLNSLGNGTCP